VRARVAQSVAAGAFLPVILALAAVTIACSPVPENGAAGEAAPEIEGADAAIEKTAEATATITRPFRRYSSQDAIDAFIAAGLEAESATPLEVNGHSPLPPTFVEAQRFQMPSSGDRTARVFSFESVSDLQAVKAYYEGITGSQASLVIVKENLLLQVSTSIPANVADAYRNALDSLD
jgi:hypothetical protein